MTSKKKRKKLRTLPRLAKIEKKEQPRKGGKFVKREEAPDLAALEALARVSGIPVPKGDLMAVFGPPWMKSQIGWVMHVMGLGPDVIARLWQCWKGLGAAQRAYRIHCLDMTGTPKGASIAMTPDPFQTDEAHSIDTRSQDERAADAKANWSRWSGYLMRLERADEIGIISAMHSTGPALWRDGRPTQAGKQTLQALKRLAKVVG